MNQARLIVDSPAGGAWNMSVDQALLDTANETGLTTLRFYQWDEPTLSLGYFQNHTDRTNHAPSLNCPLIRRRTGGGAILHDRELTYSLCVPSANRWSSKNGELYETIHQILIEFLNAHGVDPMLYRDWETLPVEKRGKQNPDLNGSNVGNSQLEVDQNAFMCFRRRSQGDIVLKGYKIVGSAQRRSKNALLQHGSILLEKSRYSPELLGIKELSGFSPGVTKTIKNLTAAAEDRLQTKLNTGKLSDVEIEAVKRVYSGMFGDQLWTARR